MSAPAAAPQGPGSWSVRSGGPLLRLVPSRRGQLRASRAPRVPFVLLVALLLGSGFVGLLLVNTALQHGAFLERDLERQVAALAEQQQELSEGLAVLESPSSLAGRAQALGMVPMRTPVFLRLSDGAVLGRPIPARPLSADDPQRTGPPAGGGAGAAGTVVDPAAVRAAAGADAARLASERARRLALRPAPAPPAAAPTAAPAATPAARPVTSGAAVPAGRPSASATPGARG